jgi:hypothetical protein
MQSETVRDLKDIYGSPLPEVLASPTPRLPGTETSAEAEKLLEDENFTFASESG